MMELPLNALPLNGGKFLFTVEQLELIRRLRNSGLTKQQVLSAFDSFERLDHQLGDVYNIPLSLALQAQMLQQLAVSGISAGTASLANISELPQQTVVLPCSLPSVQPCVTMSVMSQQQQQAAPCSDANTSVQQLDSNGGRCLNSSVSFSDNSTAQTSQLNRILAESCQNSEAGLSHPASVDMLQSSQAASVASESCSRSQPVQLQQLGQSTCTAQHNNSQSVTSPTDSQSSSSSHSRIIQQLQQQLLQSSLMKQAVNGCTVTAASDNRPLNVGCQGEEGEVDNNELMQFLSMGEVACCEEIKGFIAKYNIKQQQIASLAGVSQPYVSRYLKGDFTFMSERSCRSIKKWYLAYRKNPEAIGPAAASAANHGTMTLKKLAAMHGSYSDGYVSSPNVPSHSDILDRMLSHVARRDRFVFRQNQLDILEEFFADDSYPLHEKREQIASICNTSTEGALGRPLLDKEHVTVQIVSNWFANKRKDLRKGIKEENGDNIHVRPLVVGPDHDVPQQNTAAERDAMNVVSVENAVSRIAVNGSHVMSCAEQSPSDASDIFKPPCVVQSVYSLPV